jgi:hypothetical protein
MGLLDAGVGCHTVPGMDDRSPTQSVIACLGPSATLLLLDLAHGVDGRYLGDLPSRMGQLTPPARWVREVYVEILEAGCVLDHRPDGLYGVRHDPTEAAYQLKWDRLRSLLVHVAANGRPPRRAEVEPLSSTQLDAADVLARLWRDTPVTWCRFTAALTPQVLSVTGALAAGVLRPPSLLARSGDVTWTVQLEALAVQVSGMDVTVREIAAGLAPGWHGTLTELIDAAERLAD